MIRVPLGWANQCHLARKINPQEKSDFVDPEGRQTVELRSPDGSAIIHLLLSGIVMAADWALKDNLSLVGLNISFYSVLKNAYVFVRQ